MAGAIAPGWGAAVLRPNNGFAVLRAWRGEGFGNGAATWLTSDTCCLPQDEGAGRAR